MIIKKNCVTQVIQGWEKGLIGMCVGETRTLTVPPHLGMYQKYNFKLSHFYSILLNLTKFYSIVLNPPHLGYGDEGSSGIPGGATLHFTVDLRAVAKGKLKIKTEEQRRRERDYF